MRNGDINTGNGTAASPQGYMIGDQYVLRHNGETSNIYVGVGADALSDHLINAAAIGANAKVSASNSLVLGGTGEHAVKVGIGVTAPTETLEVNGTAKITSLACENCFVMSDKDGTLYTKESQIAELETRIKTLEQKITELYTLAKAK